MSDRNETRENTGENGFTALDISSLENVDTTRQVEEEKRSPDFDRFKLLYDEPSALDTNGDGAFKRLYEFESEETRQDNKFAPLEYGGSKRPESGSVAKSGTEEKPDSPAGTAGGLSGNESGISSAGSSGDSGKTVDDPAGSESVGKTAAQGKGPNDQAADAAFNKGFEEGKKQGYEKGFEQGQTEGFEQGFEKGRSEGFEKGEAEAAEEMEQKAEEKLETIENMIEKVDTCYKDLLQANEENILSLVQRITEKVVFAKVEVDRTVVKNTILDALEKLAGPEEIVLMVSAKDYEYIEMVKEDFFETVKSLKSVAVKSDPSIKPGGCRIESAKGVIQTDPEEKLRKVFDSVKEVAGS